jgi:hypothetical protein
MRFGIWDGNGMVSEREEAISTLSRFGKWNELAREDG